MITSRETHLSFVSPPLIFKGNRPRVFKVQTKQGHEVTSCTHKKKKQRKHMKKELNNYWGTATNYSIASRTIINRHKLRAMKQFDSIHATKSIGFKLGKPYDQSQKNARSKQPLSTKPDEKLSIRRSATVQSNHQPRLGFQRTRARERSEPTTGKESKNNKRNRKKKSERRGGLTVEAGRRSVHSSMEEDAPRVRTPKEDAAPATLQVTSSTPDVVVVPFPSPSTSVGHPGRRSLAPDATPSPPAPACRRIRRTSGGRRGGGGGAAAAMAREQRRRRGCDGRERDRHNTKKIFL